MSRAQQLKSGDVSLNLAFPDQEKLLTDDEEVSYTRRSVVAFLVAIARVSGGNRICVCRFDAGGVRVDRYWHDECFPAIGVAASWKS